MLPWLAGITISIHESVDSLTQAYYAFGIANCKISPCFLVFRSATCRSACCWENQSTKASTAFASIFKFRPGRQRATSASVRQKTRGMRRGSQLYQTGLVGIEHVFCVVLSFIWFCFISEHFFVLINSFTAPAWAFPNGETLGRSSEPPINIRRSICLLHPPPHTNGLARIFTQHTIWPQ